MSGVLTIKFTTGDELEFNIDSPAHMSNSDGMFSIQVNKAETYSWPHASIFQIHILEK